MIERHADARAVLTGGAAQVARLEGTLRAWLETGLGGPHDHAWVEARARIGARHVAVALAPHYMFTAMNVIRADLHALVPAAGVPATPTHAAIDRWLDLELAIMTQSYQASAAFKRVAIARVGDASVVISCDAGKVHQILHNLVANAVDAATSRVEVAMLAVGDDGDATIVVRDDGPGIPDAVLPRIYEPFYSTKERGAGMGLSITYSLVSLHGGSIEVRNRGGAEFTVTLPAAPPAAA